MIIVVHSIPWFRRLGPFFPGACVVTRPGRGEREVRGGRRWQHDSRVLIISGMQPYLSCPPHRHVDRSLSSISLALSPNQRSSSQPKAKGFRV